MDAILPIAELLAYAVTIVGLPLAIAFFVIEQRKERINEETEIQQTLSDSYRDFMALVLEHPDLRLLSEDATPMDAEQSERARALFSILISLFERAYLLTHRPKGSAHLRSYWSSWEDTMRDWVQRRDFREALPRLLLGEDPDFARHLSIMAAEIDDRQASPAPTSAAGTMRSE